MKEPYAILDGRTLPLERSGAEEVIRWRLPRVAVPADTREVIARFPFLDAGAGEEGYYLVPSKQACFLMNFRQREDLTYENEEALMTMFGARIGDTAWLAVTEGMDYDYRLRITVRQGHYEISMVYDLTKADFYEDLVVAFYPLTGENADYSGVARKYRQLQAAKLHLVPLAEQAKTRPVIAYTLSEMPEIRIRMGWKPVPTQVPEQIPGVNEPPMHVACTFADVEELMEEMHRQGIEKAELCLVGWNRMGHDGRWPQVFPVEPALGGEEGLKKLTAHADRLGYRVVCHTNNTGAYRVADCWDENDVIREKNGDLSVNSVYWAGGRAYNLCRRQAYEKYQPKDYEKMKTLGFHGFHYIDVIAIVAPHSCFHPDHPTNGRQTVEYINKTLARARETFGGVASEGGFDFAAANLDYALYVGFNLTQGLPEPADEVIPLWQMVYHGYLFSNPSAETVNYLIKGPVNRLRFHEFGGLPSFYVNSKFVNLEGKNWMGDVDLYCDTPEQRARTARVIRQTLEDDAPFVPLQSAFLDRHEKLAEGVYRSTFSDGRRLTVNLTDRPVDTDDGTVPAMDLLLTDVK